MTIESVNTPTTRGSVVINPGGSIPSPPSAPPPITTTIASIPAAETVARAAVLDTLDVEQGPLASVPAANMEYQTLLLGILTLIFGVYAITKR